MAPLASRQLRVAAIVLVSLVVIGCASQPTTGPTFTSWQQQRPALLAVKAWQAEGKINLRSAVQSESASLDWDQDDQVSELRLSGPWGAGATTIRATGNLVQIDQGGQIETIDISTPDAIKRHTGWDLPVHELAHWLRGLPFAETPDRGTIEQDNWLQEFRENGWIVSYQEFGQFEGFTLPVRITIERGDNRAKIVLRDWKLAVPVP